MRKQHRRLVVLRAPPRPGIIGSAATLVGQWRDGALDGALGSASSAAASRTRDPRIDQRLRGRRRLGDQVHRLVRRQARPKRPVPRTAVEVESLLCERLQGTIVLGRPRRRDGVAVSVRGAGAASVSRVAVGGGEAGDEPPSSSASSASSASMSISSSGADAVSSSGRAALAPAHSRPADVSDVAGAATTMAAGPWAARLPTRLVPRRRQSRPPRRPRS